VKRATALSPPSRAFLLCAYGMGNSDFHLGKFAIRVKRAKLAAILLMVQIAKGKTTALASHSIARLLADLCCTANAYIKARRN